MTTPKETLWVMDPHTRAKHDILGRYLSAWFPILNTWHSRIIYIDGFCGPGRYMGGEPGSPLVAIDAAISHLKVLKGQIVFWFIDERQDRIDNLKQELSKLEIPPRFNVQIEKGQFQTKFGKMMDDIDRGNGTLSPTFAFIDPFGFSGIPFCLIDRLFRHERCEVLITFMIDAMNRFLAHPGDKIVEHIVQAFGTDEAISIANGTGGGTGDRVVQLRELYQSKLREVAKYVRYFEMRDRHDRTQYYLFFATNHALGHLKMKEAMWNVDPDGDFKFSDATNPDQLVLFEANPISVLLDQMRAQFGTEKIVCSEDARRFVEEKTSFLGKHMNAALKQEEARGGISVEVLKANGNKRRKNTYPDGVKFQFVGK